MSLLIKFTPEQVIKEWNVIGKAIEESLPDTLSREHVTMESVLHSILTERSYIWGYFKDKNAGLPALFVMTTVTFDPVSMRESLLIYSIYAYEQMQHSDWVEILETLKEYARGLGCVNLTGYTSVVEIMKLVKMLDGQIHQAFLEFPL